jgi:pyridoxamine 5'-phosphate oxidase
MNMSLPSPLIEPTLHPDPISQFQRWFDEAVAAGISQPNAMTLATVSRGGQPSARIVLLKRVDKRGFEFYTNYLSRKGRELAGNPHAALTFHWEPLGRQVRIEGDTAKLSSEESDAYFHGRPVEHQIGAWASAQSEPASREELDRRYEETRARYAGIEVPRPPHWGGYRIAPRAIEFWQQRHARLHDRIRYERQADGSWRIRRLAP